MSENRDKYLSRYISHGRCEFTVWAPFRDKVELVITGTGGKVMPMSKDKSGYWSVVLDNMRPGARYLYRLDGFERADPASHFQPEGVPGPSETVDHGSFNWTDAGWKGLALPDMIIYEIHTGTFTPEGTFEGVVARLGELADLGINAIELMPVAQFPGDRNWGYDGVFPFSVQNTYGGPLGLKTLVDACHGKGIAVILDVVYNHFGPEGNYIDDFGPYHTDKYRTPWGKAINFDGPYCDEVRDFFIENAIHWSKNYHVDALRLDAVHNIFDFSARPFLKELKERADAYSGESGRRFYLIAESDLNDPVILRDSALYGYGLDAGWCEDFHHSLHALLTGESAGYYADFGDIAHFAKSLEEGFVYSGQYSEYRKKRFGATSTEIPKSRFIAFSQNHDQTGNRALGERLAGLAPFEALKLAAGAILLSPFIPLLFMGEEYGESAPYLYFISHSDPSIIEAVRIGRKKDLMNLGWTGDPPDPQSTETYLRSKIRWEDRYSGKHSALLRFYKTLIGLRKNNPALKTPGGRVKTFCIEKEKVVLIERGDGALIVFDFADKSRNVRVDFPPGEWVKVLDSSDTRWEGPGSRLPDRAASPADLGLSGLSVTLYEKNRTDLG